ncbi:hypothetical protein [Marinobacter sp. ELB17]|uniref:hypothetical protein n=1 Tax=Marinobacter sp. ELB17 TaxID=270374 RepID=UPI0000F3A888|nr:hypothetical protein [Marinobacter sp. ELB17]EAZ98272.1 hypothetical protein MELB17_08541 [Marinobacter sp. ELB17]
MATNHHDTGYKELFSHPEFVQQLIEGFAPFDAPDTVEWGLWRRECRPGAH